MCIQLHYIVGGSIANMYAMNIARQKMFPEIKTIGMCALKKPICILTSEQVLRDKFFKKTLQNHFSRTKCTCFFLQIYLINNCYHKYIDDLDECACIIEFIKEVGVKIKCNECRALYPQGV